MIKSILSLFLVATSLICQAQKVLPGKIEAEAYDAKQGVGTEATADANGGLDVGWIGDNSWMDYKVQVATAGNYTFRFRLANGFSDDAALQVKAADGTILTQFVVPRTGGMQSWKTVNVILALPAGTQTLRLYAKKGIFSINWIEVTSAKALPGRIEAEDYDALTDVRNEPTQDAGGGQDVGYIDAGDWMDYNVNLASAGSYSVNFRVANSYGNGLIEFKNAAGAVLGQVAVPRTYGWQTWTTVSMTVNLPTGGQVLRIYANRGDFNLNWFEVLKSGKTPVITPIPALAKAVITFPDLPRKNVGDAAYDLVATSTNTQTPITFVSSNPQIVSVSNASGKWKATPVAAGTATVTALQSAGTAFSAADNVIRSQVVQTAPVTPVVSTAIKIPLDPKRWYQLNNVSNGLDQLFDGVTNVNVQTGWGKVLDKYEAYYPLLEGETMTLESLRFFDFEGIFKDKPMTLSVITTAWQRIPIATFTGEAYNTWVGPYPDRSLSGEAQYKLDAQSAPIRYLVLTIQNGMPTELELYGAYTPPTKLPNPLGTKAVKLGSMFGVNAYEWNFEEGNTPWLISEPKMNMVKSFSGIRHYMDWEKLESREGVYSYNPTLSGGWNYDAIYQRCQEAGIEVLACLKTLPGWLQASYAESDRDAELVPVRSGKDFASPASYVEQARLGFQYAARYGRNKGVNPGLLSVDTQPRWTGDTPNSVKIGLGLIHYIECDNERDKWWKGRKGYQTGREYAANLSAFYDGHKGSMGVGVGVKNADPSMQVVMAGLAGAVGGADYIRGMIDWCREYRGYKADGGVNLCWDVMNFHLYCSNDPGLSQGVGSTRGAAPEVTTAAQTMKTYVQLAHDQAGDMPVWLTESGYDVVQTSPLKAIPIGSKSALDTQADWMLRMALLSARTGIDRVFYYQMYDDNNGGGVFGSSGLINEGTVPSRRPVADYLYQTAKLFGGYSYKETLGQDPLVDRYESAGQSMYAIAVPDEKGRTATYTLNLGTATRAWVYRPKAGANDMTVEQVAVTGGKVTLTATETPLFVTTSPIASGARVGVVENVLAKPEEKQPLHATVNVYPNPTADFITVSVDNSNMTDLEVTLFDANLGRLHKQLTIQKSDQVLSRKIDLSNLPVGIYVMEMKQGADRAFRKIVKTH